MPSPPALGQLAPTSRRAAATAAGSVVSTYRRRVAREQARVGGDQPVGQRRGARRAACAVVRGPLARRAAGTAPPGPRPGRRSASSSAGRRRRRRPRWPPGTGSASSSAGHVEPGRGRLLERRRPRPGSAARAAAPDGGVLVAQQLPGLGRPRQQLGVEQQPGGAELVEQAGRPRRRRGPGRAARAVSGSAEERPAGARPHRAERVAGRAEPGAAPRPGHGRPARPPASPCASPRTPPGRRPRPGRRRTPGPGARAGPGGRGRDRAHGRRQVEQPARVDREPAHHLERRRRVLLPDADPPQVGRLDDPASGHVGDVEHLGLAVRGRCGWRRVRCGRVDRERPGRLVVAPARPGRRRAPAPGSAAR